MSTLQDAIRVVFLVAALPFTAGLAKADLVSMTVTVYLDWPGTGLPEGNALVYQAILSRPDVPGLGFTQYGSFDLSRPLVPLPPGVVIHDYGYRVTAFDSTGFDLFGLRAQVEINGRLFEAVITDELMIRSCGSNSGALPITCIDRFPQKWRPIPRGEGEPEFFGHMYGPKTFIVFAAVDTPEPSSMVLSVVGLIAVGLLRRRSLAERPSPDPGLLRVGKANSARRAVSA